LPSLKAFLGGLYWSSMVRWVEWRFGDSSPRFEKTRMAHLGAQDHTPLHSYAIRTAMRTVCIRSDDVLVDVGCGSGRIISWWLHSRFRNRIVGIELDPEIAAHTRDRLTRFGNVEILTGDAVELTPREASFCFLYNPFDERVMRRWHDALLERSTSNRLTVLYVNAVHRSVFDAADRWWLKWYPREMDNLADPDILVATRRAARWG
jgi:ubiquinone/menaquinone biosynthesis C-methylase UbiE